MCRFLAYKGEPILLADLITKPDNSLITQSFKAKERKEPLNGDGFGLGWYSPEIDPSPCIFTSVTPAWANRNLHRIADKIISPCFFAHVRAATDGLAVNEINCHPFQYGVLQWMHNGSIAGFDKIKRVLRRSLSDEIYAWLQGTTDSEHAFAVFLDALEKRDSNYSEKELIQAMRDMIQRINSWCSELRIESTSLCNFAVSDGKSVIVSRYSSAKDKKPASLYYSIGSKFSCVDGVCLMTPDEKKTEAVLIASEPLTEDRKNWIEVGVNKLLVVDDSLNARQEEIF